MCVCRGGVNLTFFLFSIYFNKSNCRIITFQFWFVHAESKLSAVDSFTLHAATGLNEMQSSKGPSDESSSDMTITVQFLDDTSQAFQLKVARISMSYSEHSICLIPDMIFD